MARPRKQETDTTQAIQYNPAGRQLRRMRERAGCTRYYVAYRMGVDDGWLAWVESGWADDVDYDAMIRAYEDALEHLRRNSAPAKSRQIVWSAPSTILTREERLLWADIDAYGGYADEW
jgi:transcriptional regulator with XRE-family HTH domain